MNTSDVMMRKWKLDEGSSVPPFEQIRLRILDLAASGALPVGAKLPSVRSLAASLGVAANTVARSYRELEQAHVIETRGRAGSFVAAQGDENERMLQAAALEYAQRAERLGIDPTTALNLVTAALRTG